MALALNFRGLATTAAFFSMDAAGVSSVFPRDASGPM